MYSNWAMERRETAWNPLRRPARREDDDVPLDTKAQLARGVEQLDHVRHAGGPVLSAPSPRHTDCRARAPLAGISPSSFCNLLSLSRALSRARAAQSPPSPLALSLSFSRFYCMRRTWTQAGFNGLLLSPIFPLPLHLHLDHHGDHRVAITIMMFIECISMIMIVIMIMITIVIMITISMITTTAVLFCPPSVPVQPTRKKEGESESEGEELLIKWRVRRCSAKEREREKGRQLSRAAGQKCAHGGGEHRQSHSRALLRPGLEVRLWSSGEGSDKRLVSRCSQRRNIRRRAAVRARCCGAAVRPQPRCRAPSGRITGEAAQALLETWRVRATAEAVPRCSVAERSSDKRCWLGWQTLNPQQRDPPLKCDVTENNVAPTADVHAHPTGLNRRGKRRTSGGGGGLSIFRRTIRREDLELL